MIAPAIPLLKTVGLLAVSALAGFTIADAAIGFPMLHAALQAIPILATPVTLGALLQGVGLVLLLWVGRTTADNNKQLIRVDAALNAPKTGLVTVTQEINAWKDTHSIEAARALARLETVEGEVERLRDVPPVAAPADAFRSPLAVPVADSPSSSR